MNELDDKIRQALQKEDAELFAEFGGEPSMYEMIMETFRGRHRWLMVYGVIWTMAFFVAFIWSGVKFFNAEETRELLMWAALCIVCWTGVTMLKAWYWMEMNKNAVTREIKRLELQIARLANRIKN